MKKRMIGRGLLLGVCVALASANVTQADELRLGDYIYVPAMSVESSTGTMSLRVEGLSLSGEGDEAVRTELVGAEFGVYVIASDGTVMPWANPLYPSEPMRIRTGEGETRFTLPQGVQFYLRQESAPQGYLFDSTTLIPVTGEDIVVTNATAGQLVLAACDALGNPLAGIEMTATDETGRIFSLTTDENGEATLLCDGVHTYDVAEAVLPEGIYAASSVTAAGQTQDMENLSVSVEAATRRRVTFVHPASGTVQLSVQRVDIDDNAQQTLTPLEGVTLTVLGDASLSVQTDAAGQAQMTLLAGTYDVTLAYAGDADVLLPFEQAQMIVVEGESTNISLRATGRTGRIALTADCERAVEGGSVTWISEQTGEAFGPYALDAEGLAVTQPLEAGTYRLATLTMPEGTELGDVSCADQTAQDAEALVLTVVAGEVTQVQAQLLTHEKQTFELVAVQTDDAGDVQQTSLTGDIELELWSAQGEQVASVNAQNGQATIEALSGTYTLRMSAQTADSLGVQAESYAFELPGSAESIAFSGSQARLVLVSVDENGMAISGAAYQVMDSVENTFVVETDDAGEAVTPLLAAGNVTIATRTAPQAHADAQTTTVNAVAGEATRVELAHASYGTLTLSVRMQRLDERGNASVTALSGAGVRLYSVEQGSMTDTGLTLLTGEDGVLSMQLAPGEYAAQVETQGLRDGCRAPEMLYFTMENMADVQGELVCLDALGGVRVQLIGSTLADDALAQVRFALVAEDAGTVDLTMQDGALYAGDLAAGTYVLRQTQSPEGYALVSERTVTVAGGEVTDVSVALEEYAVLSVEKTGLTFDDALRTYIVPLTGQYGVYTMEDGVLKPYPSADAQATIWANVTPQQAAAGQNDSARLPAAVEGTTYYIKEISGAQGFAADESEYAVTLYAGQSQTLACTVASDRGFLTMEQLDESGAHVSGGEYALLDAQTGETVLSFTLGEEAYRNPMAIPVGTYVLRQMTAAQGYALSEQTDVTVEIPPYLTQGGTMADVTLTCTRVPQATQMDGVIEAIYTANEQGLMLVTVETGTLAAGETLRLPQMTVDVSAASGERSSIAGIVLSGASDALGTVYTSRVEYCLANGGWQASDARETGALTGPTAVSLADVADDICAVRVTYINAETGEELALDGFTPGQVTLSVQVSAEGETSMQAQAVLTGTFAYRTAWDGALLMMAREDEQTLTFAMQGTGTFETVSAGRDGRISGVVFMDADADGVWSAQETGRCAGLQVALLGTAGETVAVCTTDEDGRYVFDALSAGVYTVQFDAGEQLIFSQGEGYSAQKISSVQDARGGLSAELVINGDCTDYVINAGCVYAGRIQGTVLDQLDDSRTDGFGGMNVELRAVGAGEDDEPTVVTTGEWGEYCFDGLMPGTYEVTLSVPQGYLCEDAQQARIVRTVECTQGDVQMLDSVTLQKAASVSGSVRIDDDGDGMIAEDAETLSGVRVALLRVDDGHTEQVAETVTDAQGAYAFDGLFAGEYAVLFELEDAWTFTRYGEDSEVYGAVSQSGSTKSFTLAVGEQRTAICAGVTIPAELTVTVFKDTQVDGQMGVYEARFEGVSLSLIRMENGEDAQEITCTTDAEGKAVFENVSPGEYVLAYQLPGQWRSTKQVAQGSYPVSCVPQSTLSTGRSEPFTLSMGQSGQLYIGAMLSGSLSGTVYYDDDDDAAMDDTEAVCAGLTVELLDAQEQVLDVTQTDANGSYAFDGLTPGRYRVRFTAAEGCGFSGTEKTMGRGGVQKSDTSVSTTRNITVTAGAATTTADAGIVRMASISGVIWEDRNADSAFDGEETGMAGVSVQLMSGRTIVATVQTDSMGRFTFDALRPGTYKLRVDAPDGYVFSGALEGSALPLESQQDARGYSQSFTLLGGAQADGLGYGVFTQGSVSGRVFIDTNYDGVLDATESGLRGVTLTLQNASGDTVTTQTLRSGEFTLDKLMPGDYTLTVTLPDGYVFTAEGGDSIAPRTDASSISVELGTLDMGQKLQDLTIGVLQPASLGGTVWLDQDNDGRRKNGDTGMEGVCVTLTMLDGSDAGRMMETVTDATGAYRFEGVMPGQAQLSYTLADGYAFAKNANGTKRVSSVPQTDATTAAGEALNVSAGESRTDIDVGVVGVGTVSGVVWEDTAYDGMQSAEEAGVANVQVTLVSAASGEAIAYTQTDETGTYAFEFVRMGEYAVRFSLPDGMIFTCTGEGAVSDLDSSVGQSDSFALRMGESRLGLHVGAIHPASIVGRIAIDDDEDGTASDAEAGLSGAVVTALQGGTVVATTQTDENGDFAFASLRPGTYRLRITLPSHTLFAQNVQLNLSDADAVEGETGSCTLSTGEQAVLSTIPTVKAAQIVGSAWIDENVDSRISEGETMLSGVLVELLDESGERLRVDWTDENGTYAFDQLRSGTYSVRITLPEGMLITDYTGEAGTSSIPVVPGNVGNTGAFALRMGEEKALLVGGLLPGEIGDTVFLDSNRNGLQDYKEPLLSGVQLTLLSVSADGQMQEEATTISDEYGYYRFTALRPGSYVVRLDAQEGDTLTLHFGAPLGEIDSDLDPETGLSDVIVLRSGQTLRNIDVGLIEYESKYESK